MRRRSSARFLSYDLRPAKQSERKLLVDTLLTGGEAGLSISRYRYVGLGANRFYDFLMIHKYLGISDMVSIEHDSKMFKRAVFNRPFQFIRVLNTTVNNFLLNDNYIGNTIYWLDYEGAIQPDITADIASLGSKAREGDFVFVTLSGEAPGRFSSITSTTGRLDDLKYIHGDLANALTQQDVENATFYNAVFKLVGSAFSHAFGARTEGSFQPFFKVRYADTVEMVTIGGIFGGQPLCSSFLNLLKKKIPLLDSEKRGEPIFRIGKFNLTEKERGLFDLAVTAKRSNAKEINTLKELGFGEKELKGYRELLRYHPRYVETLI